MKIAVPREGQFSLILSYGILALIFFFDLAMPLGIFGGVPYVIGMIVVMWLLKPDQILTFSVFCGILALGGYFTEGIGEGMEGLVNRFMAIFTLVAIAWLIREHTEAASRYEEQQKHLTSVIDKRTEGLKQVVDQLDEYKIRLAEAEELGHFGFWEFIPSTRQMIWSNGVFAIYGYPISPQPPSMQEFIDQCHVDDIDTLQRSIQYGLSEKKSYVVEYRLVMPDGTIKWIYNRGRPVLDKQGRVEVLIGPIQDITDRKRSEETVHDNRARYTTLFKSAAVAKALIIPDKKILEVNRSFCKWIGYSERELLKMPFEKLIHKDDRSMEDAYAGDLMSGELDFFQREKRFVRKDGEVVWGLFSISAVFDMNKRVTCFAVEVINLTPLKRAEAARQKAEAAWHEAEEALTESEAARRIAEAALAERASTSASPPPSASTETPPDVPDVEDDLEVDPPAIDPQPLYATDEYDVRSHEAPVHENDVFEGSTYVDPYEPPAETAYGDTPLSGESLPGHDRRRPPEPTRHEPPAGPERRPVDRAKDDRFEMAEEIIDQLFQLSDGLMAIIGEDGFYKRLSPALNNALGFQEGALEDQHFLDFVHTDDLPEIEALMQRLFEGETIEGARFRHRCYDATFTWFTWNASFNREHRVIYSVFYAADPPAAARPAKKRVDWRRLTDKMPFQIWMIDAEHLCRYVNKKVRDFSGLPFEQLEGKGWEKTLDPDDLRDYLAYRRARFDRHEPVLYTYHRRRHDGVLRWMQETGVPLIDEQGRLEGYLMTCMDISNVKTVEHQFSEALKSALDLEDLSSALQGCRRAECQQALTDAVKIADALIENAGEVPSAELAQLMELAGEQLLDAVHHLLGFSGEDEERPTLRPRRVSLSDQVRQVVEMLRPLQREGRPRFSMAFGDEEVFVQAEQVLLHRVLETLMRHLIERANAQVMAVEVEVQHRRGIVSFKHMGDVIDPSFFSKRADLYREQGDDLRLQRYAGLELLLARRLVELMDGSMQLLRLRESGPIIRLQFPLSEPDAGGDAIPGEADAPSVAPAQPPGKHVRIQEVVHAIENMAGRTPDAPAKASRPAATTSANNEAATPDTYRQRVLVGEMNTDTQRLIRSLLQPYYELTIVPDTDVLLNEADQGAYDLVLLDVQLPGQHRGAGVLRELRKRPAYQRTPVIAVAVGASSVDQQDLIDRAGFDGFLRKPFSIVELLETVERLIQPA